MEVAIAEDVWPSVMIRLHASVGSEAYDAWFARLRADVFEGATARLSVPTSFLKQWIENRYLGLVLSCIKAEAPYIRRLSISERGPVLRYAVSPSVAGLLSGPDGSMLPPPQMPLAPLNPSPPPPILSGASQIVRIQRWTAKRFGIHVSDLKGPSRRAPFVMPRQFAIYVSRTYTGRSLPDVGRRFGGRDHTTVLHATRKFSRIVANDPYWAALADDCLFDLGITNAPAGGIS